VRGSLDGDDNTNVSIFCDCLSATRSDYLLDLPRHARETASSLLTSGYRDAVRSRRAKSSREQCILRRRGVETAPSTRSEGRGASSVLEAKRGSLLRLLLPLNDSVCMSSLARRCRSEYY
jgi:hypothetical protein